MKQITCPHCGDTYPDFDVAHVCSRGPYAPRLKPRMSERIDVLALQATDIKGGLDRHKFAELIVRECAEFVREYPEKYLTRGQANEIGSGMEEHFGVEE